MLLTQGERPNSCTVDHNANSSSDVLAFSKDVLADAAEALAVAHQDGSDGVFTIDTETTLTLKNVQLASLNDFHFV